MLVTGNPFGDYLVFSRSAERLWTYVDGTMPGLTRLAVEHSRRAATCLNEWIEREAADGVIAIRAPIGSGGVRRS